MSRHSQEDEPAGGRSRATDADDRRERILEAASRLFAERGVKNVTVRDVAVAAGVTHPLIYYYWGSKEDLLSAAVEHSQARVRRAPLGEHDALDAIMAIVRESLEHNQRYLQTLTRALLDGMTPSDWPGGFPGVEGALERLTAGLEPGGEADQDARERLACAVSMLLGWSLIERQLLGIVGLPTSVREHARGTLLTSIRHVLEPAARVRGQAGGRRTRVAGDATEGGSDS